MVYRLEPVRAKIAAKQEGKDPELAAMCVISGKSEDELKQMPEEDLTWFQATAALFPDELVEVSWGKCRRGGGTITPFTMELHLKRNIYFKYLRIDQLGKNAT